jgi:tetratricopeptide (TPR) repeat protein
MDITVRISDAWQLQRDGRNQESADAFDRLLTEAPESVDAHYGAGLAHKHLGNLAVARQHFEQALILADRAETAQRDLAATRTDGMDWSDPKTDYYMMMKRMINQRIAEVSDK